MHITAAWMINALAWTSCCWRVNHVRWSQGCSGGSHGRTRSPWIMGMSTCMRQSPCSTKCSAVVTVRSARTTPSCTTSPLLSLHFEISITTCIAPNTPLTSSSRFLHQFSSVGCDGAMCCSHASKTLLATSCDRLVDAIEEWILRTCATMLPSSKRPPGLLSACRYACATCASTHQNYM